MAVRLNIFSTKLPLVGIISAREVLKKNAGADFKVPILLIILFLYIMNTMLPKMCNWNYVNKSFRLQEGKGFTGIKVWVLTVNSGYNWLMTDTSRMRAVLSYQVCTTPHEMSLSCVACSCLYTISNPKQKYNWTELSASYKAPDWWAEDKNHLHHTLHASAGGQD